MVTNGYQWLPMVPDWSQWLSYGESKMGNPATEDVYHPVGLCQPAGVIHCKGTHLKKPLYDPSAL